MPTPSRWRLLDYDTDAVIAECGDIDGLFTDRVFPVPPVYERYTLLGCAPEGPLRAAVDGTGPAWLGNVYLQGAHALCSGLANCTTCYNTGEELLDVRVVGHTPAADGLLDVELEGHRSDELNNDRGTRAPAVSGYRLTVWPAPDGSEELLPAGDCRDVAGVFHERPDPCPPGPPLTLLGCRAAPSGLLNAKLAHVRVDGTVHVLDQWVYGDVVATRPSALGDGLVDVELDARLEAPLAANQRPLYDMWRAGGPAGPNEWAGLERSDRYLWVRAALAHRIHARTSPTARCTTWTAGTSPTTTPSTARSARRSTAPAAGSAATPSCCTSASPATPAPPPASASSGTTPRSPAPTWSPATTARPGGRPSPSTAWSPGSPTTACRSSCAENP
ncbi:hypothetical protein [Dactylosporangium sp. NPDC000521]|uniref:hypothetical protein n=1 Tax=Dactylosporangium sp. NPDC000521 TaxID=3363975 RepID=UPI0036B89B2D